MILFIYNIFLHIYFFSIKIVSLFNQKAKDWIDGRNTTNEFLKNNDLSLFTNAYIIHCASVGEFEQARPLIEKLKQNNNNEKIILTFYSPSGYNLRKNYPFVDQVLYLPFDFRKNITLFIQKLQPKAVIIVKYEFWYNLLNECFDQNIPVYLISAIFRKQQIFFKPLLGNYFRAFLHKMSCIFLQNFSSNDLLKTYDIKNTIVAGDTRYDRVLSIIEEKIDFENIKLLIDKKKCLIVGSAWTEDISLIAKAKHLFKNYFIIIVPHEIQIDFIQLIQSKFENNILHSKIETNTNNVNVLIIDKVGLLSKLYSIADIAYVGGGFGKGIHNTLEPAVWSIPVIFGPRYHNFYEAHELISNNLAKSVHNIISLEKAILWAENIDKQRFYNSSKQFFNERKGATNTIFQILKKTLY